MKKKLMIALIMMIGFQYSNAQDLKSHEVPSVIINKFKQTAPDAKDVEWEMESKMYKVEYELGRDTDHTIWYNEAGNIEKKKEEISKKNLPREVINSIDKKYSGYNYDDIERITEGDKVTYIMELNSLLKSDWKIAVDADGNILSEIED